MWVKSHTIVADISPQSVQASKPPAPLFLRLKRAAAISETTDKLSGGMPKMRLSTRIRGI